MAERAAPAAQMKCRFQARQGASLPSSLSRLALLRSRQTPTCPTTLQLRLRGAEIKDRAEIRSPSTAFETVLPPCSDAGGIEIEENWDRVKSITIPTLGKASGDALAPLLGGLPLELRPGIENFIRSAYAVSAALTIWLITIEFFNQPRAR